MQMGNIFTFAPSFDEVEVLIQLPEVVCYSGNSGFLLNKVIRPAGIPPTKVAFQSIPVPAKGKLKKTDVAEIMDEAGTFSMCYSCDVLLCGSADVFKWIVPKGYKFLENVGRVIPNSTMEVGTGKTKKVVVDEGTFQVVPLLNPSILSIYPHKVTEVYKSLSVAKELVEGSYKEPETLASEIEVNEIITDPDRAYEVLSKLFKKDILFCDIETTGLRWQKDRLLTMSFAVSSKEAYCFALSSHYYEDTKKNNKLRNYVTKFLEQYEGKMVWHNMAFDVPFITHELLRKKDFSVPHEPIISSFDLGDTMIMAYLLMNSTERPSIGLKNLAYKWLGNYDGDIDQSRLEVVSLEKVGTYNNLDVIATALLYEELQTQVEAEGFKETYDEFIEIGKQLIKVKMNGLRVDLEEAEKFEKELETLLEEDKRKMLEDPNVKRAEYLWAEQKRKKATTKTKKDVEDYMEEFNPASPSQKKLLFFDVMGMPVINKSKTTKEPSADGASMNEWLSSPETSEDKKKTIQAVIDYQLANKIKSTYIAAILENAVEVSEGDFRIFANFNQTSTISGRLSSSGDINFQTIPSSSKYAKKVKKLFIAPDGFILGTADYSALEDRLMANESKDENKIAIFEKGIDGHSLNAYGYFKDEFAKRGLVYDITDPNSINKVKDEAPDLRQDGKSYTFGFSYGAGPKKYGEDLYTAYWELYKGVKEYNDTTIKKAERDGYLISKFSGLRLKLPSIKASDAFVKQKEERVAVNFAIQSGNFLMLRAINKLQNWIEDNNLIGDVKIINTVHDSVYLYIKKDPETVAMVNEKLIEYMCEPYEEDLRVQLEAELDIGDNMVNFTTIPNNISSYDLWEKYPQIFNWEG